jgi:hypothetical protein
VKKLLSTSLRGQRGINLVEKIVLEMGFTWTQTGALETGIDGIIETREHHYMPARVVIHKRSIHSRVEVRGFTDAAADNRVESLKLLSLRSGTVRLFREGAYPALRGTLLRLSDKTASPLQARERRLFSHVSRHVCTRHVRPQNRPGGTSPQIPVERDSRTDENELEQLPV